MTPRPAKCAHCKTRLERVGQRIHEACVGPWYEANRDKLRAKAEVQARRKVEAAKKQERAQDRAKREAGKSIRTLIAEAQTAFNAFIRTRDAKQPCICCGKPFEPQRPGGSMDAGHYMSRGSSCQLRFDEANVHGQRKNCNRPGGTTRASFRAGMIARVGLAEVERLERDDGVRKWTHDELRAIRDQYKAKVKQLKREAAL
jgi:hypothetical protein